MATNTIAQNWMGIFRLVKIFSSSESDMQLKIAKKQMRLFLKANPDEQKRMINAIMEYLSTKHDPDRIAKAVAQNELDEQTRIDRIVLEMLFDVNI